jgi:ABC-type microcin C transport system permease subunit YejE
MKKDYFSEKEAKRRTTKQGMWFLMIFIILFIVVIVRIALRGVINDGLLSTMPSGSDAYEMAKDYIKPTLKIAYADFPEQDYQYNKGADSVYVVKSYFETKDVSGSKVKTNFTVSLKYNGGTISEDRNWTLINIQEH